MKKEEKKEKTNKGFKILGVIVGIVGIVLSFILGYMVATNTTDTKEKNEIENEIHESSQEKEIKDFDVLTELSTKIDTILGLNARDVYEAYKIYGTYKFKYKALKANLSNEEKLEIVLQSIKWDKITGEEWKNNKSMKSFCDSHSQYSSDGCQMFLDSSYQLTEEKVNNYSLQLFGEKIENSKEQMGKCPMYIYDSNQKMYYRPNPQCGGTSGPDVIHSYKSKFIQKDNEAHVYISIAHLAPNPENFNGEMLNLYKDFDLNDNGTITLKDCNDKNSYYNPNINVMTITDYKLYSEYKFIFKQDKNGNYYFVKVEQTK